MEYSPSAFDLFEPYSETPEVSVAMESFRTQWLKKHRLSDKTQLYHYTTLAGMQGILRDRSLWCGHASSLNDPLEIQYGREVIESTIRDAMEGQNRQDLRKFLQEMLIHIQAFGQAVHQPFLACFCDSGNLLSQWLGYSSSGRGYCLGFQFSGSTRIVSEEGNLNHGWAPVLRKVIYNKDGQRKLVKEYCEIVVDAARKSLDSSLPPTPNKMEILTVQMAFQAANILFDLLLSFKHPAFESEGEWRLLRVTAPHREPEKLRFRESAGSLIPYRPTHIYDKKGSENATFPLRSIGFGPMLEPERTRTAIELWLQHIAADKHPIKIRPHSVDIEGPGYSLRKG
jgi:hypothetical protein